MREQQHRRGAAAGRAGEAQRQFQVALRHRAVVCGLARVAHPDRPGIGTLQLRAAGHFGAHQRAVHEVVVQHPHALVVAAEF